MLKKLTLPTLLLAATLSLAPGVAQAREYDAYGRPHHRIFLRFGFGHREYGYHDRYGNWIAYGGYYDHRGHWHPNRW